MDFDETLRKCSIAESPACNQTYVCELINKSVAEAGGKLLECDVTCCQTDRCNGPDEGCCLCYTDKIIHWVNYNENDFKRACTVEPPFRGPYQAQK